MAPNSPASIRPDSRNGSCHVPRLRNGGTNSSARIVPPATDAIGSNWVTCFVEANQNADHTAMGAVRKTSGRRRPHAARNRNMEKVVDSAPSEIKSVPREVNMRGNCANSNNKPRTSPTAVSQVPMFFRVDSNMTSKADVVRPTVTGERPEPAKDQVAGWTRLMRFPQVSSNITNLMGPMVWGSPRNVTPRDLSF